MSYEGQAVKILPLDDGFVELRFDLQGESVNKFNAATMGELEKATLDLRGRKDLRGVLITSGKDVFFVGADVTEFVDHFRKRPRRHSGIAASSGCALGHQAQRPR